MSMFSWRSAASSGVRSGSAKNRSYSESSMQSTDAPDSPVPRGSHDTTSNRSVISGGNQLAALSAIVLAAAPGPPLLVASTPMRWSGSALCRATVEFERRALRIVVVDRHGDRADVGAVVDRFPGDAVGQRLGGAAASVDPTDLDGGGRHVADIACDGWPDLRPGVDVGDRTRRQCHTQRRRQRPLSSASGGDGFERPEPASSSSTSGPSVRRFGPVA